MQKTKYILLLLVVFSLIVLGIKILYTKNSTPVKQNNLNQFSITDTLKQNSNIHQPDTTNNISRDTIHANWKKYSNTKLRISFQYPKNWVTYGKESVAVNRNEEVMSIMTSLIDTSCNSIFSIEYHLPPYGVELYQYAQNTFDSIKTLKHTINIDGNKALETSIIKSSDIKGNTFNPLRIIQIVLLDKQGGEYFIRFETPLSIENSEIFKFNKLISSCKLLKE